MIHIKTNYNMTLCGKDSRIESKGPSICPECSHQALHFFHGKGQKVMDFLKYKRNLIDGE